MSQKTFCVIPWLHRMTDEQGFHQLCCTGVGNGNLLRDADGKRLHVAQKLTDDQVLNSPTLKIARGQMVRGEWPAACERCQQVEEAGGVSVRHHNNRKFDQARKLSLLERTSADGTLEDAVVRYADIRLGNVCNLTCRMCGPVASRLWAPHYNQAQPKKYRMDAEELKILGQNNWVKQESLGWLLEQSLPHVDVVHFAGGEPLIVPEMAKALEQCIESGRAGEIGLSYNTNLTVLPEKVTRLWRHFRDVTLLCSVDGYGRLNDYIRRPSQWNDIDRNLRLLDEHFDEWNIRWAAVSATVQIYNALTIHELFDYIRKAGFVRIEPVPLLTPLYNPPYLSIQALPPEAKKVASARLQNEIELTKGLDINNRAAAVGSIQATIAFMDAADTTNDLPDFLSYCRSSDREFKDNWREAAPELAAHLDGLGVKGVLRKLGLFGARPAGTATAPKDQ